MSALSRDGSGSTNWRLTEFPIRLGPAIRRKSIVRLVGQVVRVSVEPVKPVTGLPEAYTTLGEVIGMARRTTATRRKALIARIVKRIATRFHPEKIILFGSHARGDAGPDSDVDLLVVMPVRGSKLEQRLKIRGALHDFAAPLDVIVTTPEEYAWRKDVVGTIEWPAAREGKVLYARL
jgi:predicted nucleotidyltransferase